MDPVITTPQDWIDYFSINAGYLGSYQRVGSSEGLMVSGNINYNQLIVIGLIGLVAYMALKR